MEVEIPSGEVKIKGIFSKPERVYGLVIFAHGSGSGRLSLRNTFVARELEKARLATLLIDLLTTEEEVRRENVFDIGLLARRLKDATHWALTNPQTKDLPIGYFGASTGAAAALRAAAELPRHIQATVSRGGRPDLAMEYLGRVVAPTLLIVGERDEAIIPLNEAALKLLRGEKELAIVAGATHLFEEAGALEEAARLARDWFLKYFKNRK